MGAQFVGNALNNGVGFTQSLNNLSTVMNDLGITGTFSDYIKQKALEFNTTVENASYTFNPTVTLSDDSKHIKPSTAGLYLTLP